MDEDEFKALYKPKMDWSVSNVGILCRGAVALHAFEEFLDTYLGHEETARDFYRVKAVLDVAGRDEKFVVQCVHMVITSGFAEPWGGGQPRVNRILFIGCGMQKRRHVLTEQFKACIAKPLRFQIGDEVRVKARYQCRHEHQDHSDYGHGHSHHAQCEDDLWDDGRVIKHWDGTEAYTVRLHGGLEVRAPLDEDRFVTAPPITTVS